MALQELLQEDYFPYKSPYSTPWFTLNDALAWSSKSDHDPYMLEAGCRLPSGGWNCTAACIDSNQGPELLWGQRNSTIATLVNCLMLPYVVTSLISGTLEDPKELARKYNILPDADVSFSDSYMLLGKMWSVEAYPVVSDCFTAYCNVTKPVCGTEPLEIIPQESSGFPHFHSGICFEVDMSLNTDIAGIGVNVSYIMQSFVLLTAYFIQKAESLQRDIGPKMMPDRQMAALVAALVEFQKTQVFFMLSVEIAVIVALFNAAYVSVTSWDQLWTNLGFMQAIGFNGVYTTVFGLLLLKKAGKASWYISLTSLCCVLVSSITIFKSRGTGVRPEQISHEIPGLTACFNQDPSQYCLGSHADVYAEAQITPSTAIKWICSLVIVLVMMADKLSPYRTRAGLSMVFHALDVAGRWMSKRLPRTVCQFAHRSYKSVLLAFAEVWLVWRTCSRIKFYISVLRRTESTTADTVWPLGQIISVAVWVPVLVEYFYLLFHGIEKGSLYRLVPPYYVTGVAPGSPANTGTQTISLSTVPIGQQQSSTMLPIKSIMNSSAQRMRSPGLSNLHQPQGVSSTSSVRAPLLGPPRSTHFTHSSTW